MRILKGTERKSECLGMVVAAEVFSGREEEVAMAVLKRRKVREKTDYSLYLLVGKATSYHIEMSFCCGSRIEWSASWKIFLIDQARHRD